MTTSAESGILFIKYSPIFMMLIQNSDSFFNFSGSTEDSFNLRWPVALKLKQEELLQSFALIKPIRKSLCLSSSSLLSWTSSLTYTFLQFSWTLFSNVGKMQLLRPTAANIETNAKFQTAILAQFMLA